MKNFIGKLFYGNQSIRPEKLDSTLSLSDLSSISLLTEQKAVRQRN